VRWSSWRAATVHRRCRWRGRALLAVSDGCSYTDAALLVGRALGDSVAAWVARFNQMGPAALERQPGGRPPTQYGAEERDRTLSEFRRLPDRERDGTATWSLNTLQRALRRAPDGLPKVSTYTIWADSSRRLDLGVERYPTGVATSAGAPPVRSYFHWDREGKPSTLLPPARRTAQRRLGGSGGAGLRT
jgi:transposase